MGEPRTIWKFILTPGEPIMMPEGKVLSAHAQGTDICIWAYVLPDTPLREVHFNVFPTGARVPDMPGEFISTVLLHGGQLVFHVFKAGGQ